MSLLLGALAAAGGVILGRWAIWGRVGGAKRETAEAAEVGAREATGARPHVHVEGESPRERELEETIERGLFPCSLGDVVMRVHDGAEAWLEGGIVLSEDGPAAALFVAPDAAGERAIFAWPRPTEHLAWLAPVAGGAEATQNVVVLGGEPPSAIEIEGVRFERRRRLPLRLQRIGVGAPDLGATGVLGEYESVSGEVAVVVVGEGTARAWRGRRLAPGEFEVWQKRIA